MDEVTSWRWGDAVEPLRSLLRRGGLLAIPTESYYGLAVDPRHERAVSTIYRVKRRCGSEPLPVLGADLGQIASLGVRLEEAETRGLLALWPAPLSFVLPLAGEIAAAAGAGRLAVRVPAHERLRALLRAVGLALTATSANRSGEPAIVDPADLPALLSGEDAIVLDDGVLPGGLASTILSVAAEGVELLRRGRYPLDCLPAGVLSESRPRGFSAAVVEMPVEESS